MPTETTIPILPCHSIDETLRFYVALGFEITYKQARPNTYAVVRRGGIELHFFTMRGYEPAQSYSTCYVLTTDVDELYRAFAAGLRSEYGKLPSSGIPRVTALRNKADNMRGFIVIDPGGNWVRIGQKVEAAVEGDPSEPGAGSRTPLVRAVEAANLLADSKGDYEAAARVLDKALAQPDAAPPEERVMALLSRAGVASALGDAALAARLLAEVRGTTLNDAQKALLAVELERALDLEQILA